MTNNLKCDIIALQTNEEQVMRMGRYVIGDDEGRYLIMKHGHSPEVTSDLSRAKRFEDNLSAQRVMKSSVPKSLGANWKPIDLDVVTSNVKQNREYKKVDLQSVYKKINNEFLPVKEIMGNKEALERQLKEIELIKCDLEHLIETTTLNGAEGYLVYKVFRVVRNKRREIKNELAMIDFFKTAKITDFVERTDKIMSGMETRKYAPRSEITKRLFDSKKITSKDINKICEEIKEIA